MPFIGEIRSFAGSFAPSGWARCNGQLLPIGTHTTLFSMLGTRFGGDGVTNFALPDLRGRVPIGPGAGPTLTPRAIGDSGGVESHALTAGELATHTHQFRASKSNGTTTDPANGVFSRSAAAIPAFASPANVDLANGMLTSTGGGEPHNNMQPFIAVTYIIALQGFVAPRP